jgi:hypothetical protein
LRQVFIRVYRYSHVGIFDPAWLTVAPQTFSLVHLSLPRPCVYMYTVYMYTVYMYTVYMYTVYMYTCIQCLSGEYGVLGGKRASDR